MNIADAFIDGFGRIRSRVDAVLDEIGPRQLSYRVTSDANSISWLIWHLTRVQDDHLADAGSYAQLWIADGWARRFALSLDDTETGYGHTSSDVDALASVDPGMLVAYHHAVSERTCGYLAGLVDSHFDRVVDERADGPVSLGVRVVSVIADSLQHVGQAAYIRGIAT